MMSGDARYDIVKMMIAAGKIKSFSDIFIYIPKTTVYKDLGINFNRFCRAISDPSLFKGKELLTLAELFGIEANVFLEFIFKELLTNYAHTKQDSRR
jgi:hypothetical protein